MIITNNDHIWWSYMIDIYKDEDFKSSSVRYKVILGSHWGRFRFILDQFGVIVGYSWDHSGIILGSFENNFWVFFGSLWAPFETVPKICSKNCTHHLWVEISACCSIRKWIWNAQMKALFFQFVLENTKKLHKP